MKNHEKQAVKDMWQHGSTPTEISRAMGISVHTIRTHIRRHLCDTTIPRCLHCGKPLPPVPGRKPKKFCCDKCRMAWWNSHRESVNRKAFYTLICQNCGKEFESYGNKNRKFCCRDCYLRSRRADSAR